MTRLVLSVAPLTLLALPIAAWAQPIASGPSNAANGYLTVSPDAYGSWADTTFGGGGDAFKPTGALLKPVAFTSGFYVFSGTNRELLSDSADWQAVNPADASLSRSITSPNAASDTNGDGVDDTLQSRFSVSGSGVNLGFSLRQHVQAVSPGVSFLRQVYTITNDASTNLSFTMARAFDGDLTWVGDYTDDFVGTSMHGAGLGTSVFQNERNIAARGLTLSANAAQSYFGGKHGVDPDGAGAGPAYGFGTDVIPWTTFGVPTTWQNHIAGLGYNLNGNSGAAPVGSTAPTDAFMGLNFSFDLDAGESVRFTLFHTYGSSSPVPAPSTVALFGLAAVALRRRRR